MFTTSGACRTSLWERACSRWHRRSLPGTPGCHHRRQASSHRFGGVHNIWGLPLTFVGAGLLAMASPQFAWHTGLSPSQASQLPQVWRCSQHPGLAAHLCGSGLARDGIAAVCLIHRAVSIAGKPAPTGLAVFTTSGACRTPLWERACSRWYRRSLPDTPGCQHRRQASSHRFGGVHNIRGLPLTSVGAGLLAMASPQLA